MEVENRPADGLKTVSPEEPYTNSVRTVLWELGASNRPWLPDTAKGIGITAYGEGADGVFILRGGFRP